jgi:hypothetical protein
VAAPDATPAAGRKVKPGTAVVVVAVVALAGILYIRYRAGKASPGPAVPGSGTVTSSTTYGLGPEWFAAWTRDHHGPPSKKHPRGFTDWQGHR